MKIISNAIFREKAIYEDLITTDVKQSDGSTIHYIDSDLILLFNQERLQALGQTAMIEYLNSIVPQSDSLAELRKNCTDEELLSMVKSRHIQSRSDLLAWSKYLDSELDHSKDVAEKLKASQENKISFNEIETPKEV